MTVENTTNESYHVEVREIRLNGIEVKEKDGFYFISGDVVIGPGERTPCYLSLFSDKVKEVISDELTSIRLDLVLESYDSYDDVETGPVEILLQR